jgi:hypothetical protein
MTISPRNVRGHERLPVDGHVHLYTPELAAATFDSAADNFRAYGGREAGRVGVLLLTQGSRERVFETLRKRRACGSWRIKPSAVEEQSLTIESGARSIAVICGRQIRCERGLEVAALGTTDDYADGLPFDETIGRVQASGAWAVIPWGFGKWTGSRGEQVRGALARYSPRSLSVADNGGRLALLGSPQIVRAARASGYRVLSGSDPFPCGDDHRRVGAFGFFAGIVPGEETPWRDLSTWLASAEAPETYGSAVGMARFLVNQIGIQSYNRKQRKADP